MSWISNVHFNIISIIDIVLVAFILYKLIMLIKDTRAIQILKGVFILYVAYNVSNWLELATMEWLLKQAMAVLVVALPVMFAPELRRWLEQIGRGGKLIDLSLTKIDDEAAKRMIKEIVDMACLLSKDKIGALLVLERDSSLEEYIRDGVKIDALVKCELLINIFTPNTPLHDGASVIRGDRIAASAVILPLTENPFLSKELGTRHRAAIGITEATDAVCVVVSEETGTISITEGGKITRFLDEDSLRTSLQSVIKTKEASLWRSFLHDRREDN